MEKIEKDCSQFFSLNDQDFITAVYRELLEREPDNEGFADMMRKLYQGMPKEAVVYQIAYSVEFAGRFIIKYLDDYKKINKKYIINNKIKKIPIIGWFIRFSKLPEVHYNLRMMEVDLFLQEKNLQERLGEIHEKLNCIEVKQNENNDWLKENLIKISIKVDAANGIIEWTKNNTINIEEKVNGVSNIIEWAKNNTINIIEKVDITNREINKIIEIAIELSQKVDMANGIIEWAKNNTINIIEKVDAAYENNQLTMNNNTECVLDTISDIPKTYEIFPKFDVQRIINKGLFPACGMEGIQADLITFLNDKTDEFDAYNKIPIEEVIKYVDGKTVIASHYSQLISDYVKENQIIQVEAVDIEPVFLSDLCCDKDTLIITNPALSALILASPEMLSEISQRLNRNLVLVVRVSTYPISAIIWDGFSFYEEDNENRKFKWAQGGRGIWRIKLTNALARTIDVNFNWFSDSICNRGMLTAACNGKTISYELNGLIKFNLNVTLRPGVNNIDFLFYGPSIIPENDKRILAFRIIDFSCNFNILNNDKKFINKIFDDNIEQECLKITNNNAFLPDDYIRQILHQNGFYDVSSFAYANHGMSKREMAKTRYEFPLNYQIINDTEKNYIEPDEIMCYIACRLRKNEN